MHMIHESIHIYTCIHIFTYTYTHIHVYSYIHGRVHTDIQIYIYIGDRMSRVGGWGFLPCTWSCLTLNSLFLLVTKSLITPLATVKNTLRFYNQTPLRAPEFATVTHFQPTDKRGVRVAIAWHIYYASRVQKAWKNTYFYAPHLPSRSDANLRQLHTFCMSFWTGFRRRYFLLTVSHFLLVLPTHVASRSF